MSALDLLFRRLTDSGIGEARLPYAVRAAALPLSANDNGGWFDLTGTFTQTFFAAASIGADKSFVLRNSGTGDVTLDPDGSELIDGLASYVMYPGEVRLIQCDGVQFRSLVLRPFAKVYTASGTFIKPPGYGFFDVFLVGGGGGGGGAGGPNTTSPTPWAGGNGGSGGSGQNPTVPETLFSASNSVTVGSGGAPGVSAPTPTDGGVGGTTSIATSSGSPPLSAAGGMGGLKSTSSTNGAAGANGGTSGGVPVRSLFSALFSGLYAAGGTRGRGAVNFSSSYTADFEQPTGGLPGVARIMGVL